MEEQITEAGGPLLTHYQAPIVDGNDVYHMEKGGTYVACSVPRNWRNGEQCGPNVWHTMTWSEVRYSWVNGNLRRAWAFESDWKPPPNGWNLRGWEPVFHPLDANGFIYVPGAGGAVWRVNKATGEAHDRIDPFAGTGAVAANTFVISPLSADAQGNLYYNAIELTRSTLVGGDPWLDNPVGSWLVKVTPAGRITKATYASLVPGAPAPGASTCPGIFGSFDPLPWPPDPDEFPPDVQCGAQRPGVNVAPAIAPDGTIYTVSRAQLNSMAGYLVAVNPDLTPKWAASLQHRLHDGCGVLMPIAPDGVTNMPNSCRFGTATGVDPTTNRPGSGTVNDVGTSSPAVLPDGSVLYGAYTRYNAARGHLMRFAADGDFTGAYHFGWDITPAIWEHDGTYSIVVKDNHYGARMYCNDAFDPVCAFTPVEYYITQLDANLEVEWRFKSTSDDPDFFWGYEFCINMPAIDAWGTVYVNSEDGHVYALTQGRVGDFTEPASGKFLTAAIGAAYTPLSLGADGRVYTQNFGHLFVIGN